MKHFISILFLTGTIYGQATSTDPTTLSGISEGMTEVHFENEEFSFDDGEINGFGINLKIDTNVGTSISFETENNPIGAFLIGIKIDDGKYRSDLSAPLKMGETSLSVGLEVDATCATAGDYYINLKYRIHSEGVFEGQNVIEGVNTTKVTISSKERLAPLYECLEPNALNFLAESELSQLFDTDGNGQISPAEYYRLVESAGGN
jgi:hypothetical protein